ncbi:MAG: tRNA (adenosine(37)-N6)-threonylcarbamoyltransferase complex dimerization subunit type 1 TsaB [Chloroflexi bacterium]|nr:tRNA (adenosine(37)-N6)-threonylcarbamoyltransferase complex dimerization subunit type 1 TsaB [Chloroflexota bacterium]
MTLMLALDTATQYASIALYDGEQVIAELNWRSQRRHTVELAVQVDNLFHLQHLTPNDLEVVAVAIGPGSFTGSRIALSYAKGLVAVNALPLVAVPTLDCLAYVAPSESTPICALVAAGRRRFCWAVYSKAGSSLQRQTDWGLHPLPEILTTLSAPTYFIGELNPTERADLLQAPQVAGVAAAALSVRRAGVLAELGWARWQAKDIEDPVTLSPIYLS